MSSSQQHQEREKRTPRNRQGIDLLPGLAKETYLDSVATEALGRVGANTQLKGTIHEILIRDRHNTSMAALARGERAVLTPQTTATTVDLSVIRQGKVIGRIQAKDVTSSVGVTEIQRRVANRHYRSAQLVGTEETAARYNALGGGKNMRSSGVSSTTTTRIADNAGVRVPNKNLLTSNLQDVAKQAQAAAILSATISATVEAVRSFNDVSQDRITAVEYAGRVAKAGGTAAASAGVKTAAALVVKEGAKVAAKRMGAEGFKRAAGSNPATAVAFGLVEQATDTFRFVSGKIDRCEFGNRTLQNTGGTGGAIAGAAYGATLGSIVPGVGTAIGGLVGGIIGGIGGNLMGGKIGSWLFA